MMQKNISLIRASNLHHVSKSSLGVLKILSTIMLYFTLQFISYRDVFLVNLSCRISPIPGAACTGARYYHTDTSQNAKDYDYNYNYNSFQKQNVRVSPRRYTEEHQNDSTSSVLYDLRHPHCQWCDLDESCLPIQNMQMKGDAADESSEISTTVCAYRSNDDVGADDADSFIKYESTCPLSPSYLPEQPHFLEHWMTKFMSIKAFSEAPLSAITLPGTHDSLSYDLSLTVSTDGIDNMEKISSWLRALSIVRPNEIEEFMRLQAMTQKLDIIQQLDNGIRFIDLRIALEREEDEEVNSNYNWYSIHGLQSNHPVKFYLELILTWMEEHPHEIIIIYLSRLGDTDAVGNDAYPDTSVEEKRHFWKSYVDLFGGMLFDTSISDYHGTSMEELLQRRHRVVTFAADYKEFTDKSKFAYDAKGVDNEYNGDCFNEEVTIAKQRKYFFRKKKHQYQNHGNHSSNSRWFSLKGMNTSVNDWQVKSALRQRFLPIDPFDSCAKKVNIPGNAMCPRSVLEIAQLTNYYNQIPLDEAYLAHVNDDDEREVFFPHAFYLDAIDYGGTIRTGTTTLYGQERKESEAQHRFARYTFVDTILGFNLRNVCKVKRVVGTSSDGGICDQYATYVKSKRSENPSLLWQEPEMGRLNDWPTASYMKSGVVGEDSRINRVNSASEIK